MKKLLVLFFLVCSIKSFTQETSKPSILPFQKPSEGKSLVYILKSGAGIIVPFNIYLNDKFVGELNFYNSFVIECEPGYHVFWIGAENRDYIAGDFLPNKVYVLKAEGQMGLAFAGVRFYQLYPFEKSEKNFFSRHIRNNKSIFLKQNDFTSIGKEDNIKKGLEKFEELKKNNSPKIGLLKSDYNFENGEKFQKQ